MMNEEMIKFAQIRSSYARKRFEALSNEEKALIDYETFCLELIKKNDDLQQRIDKAIKILGNYRHYTLPEEEQNRENENLVDEAYKTLGGKE